MANATKPLIICVDDEQGILDGLNYTLRAAYRVQAFTNPLDVVPYLDKEPEVSVLISDMRMPQMSGADLLALIGEKHSHVVRILLTGQADMNSAIRAINEGQIFRFLSKPCPPAVLARAVSDAHRVYVMRAQEKSLLEQTVNGCIKALVESMALSCPYSFGRSLSIHRLAEEIAVCLGLEMDWRLDAAGLMALVGFMVLPSSVAEKIYTHKPLSDAEQKMARRIPDVTRKLVSEIPRMEEVTEILGFSMRGYLESEALSENLKVRELSLLGNILHLSIEFDRQVSQGIPPVRALGILEARNAEFNPRCLEALVALKGGISAPRKVCELSIMRLREGSVLAADLYTKIGELIIPAGQPLTNYAIQKIRNIPVAEIQEPAYVYLDDQDKVA